MSMDEERSDRQDRSKYKTLLATPALTTVTLPANAQFCFKAIGIAADGATVATITGPTNRTIKTKALVAGGFTNTIYLQRASVVTLNSNFDLMLNIGLGKYKKVGRGV